MLNYDECIMGIDKTLLKNQTCMEIFNYLTLPTTVNNLMVFCEAGLPAISGIANILESKYSNNSDFPISKPQNRRYIGKAVKYILSFYGYTPSIGGLAESARLKKFTNTKYFKTATVYIKNSDAPLKITVKSEPNI